MTFTVDAHLINPDLINLKFIELLMIKRIKVPPILNLGS